MTNLSGNGWGSQDDLSRTPSPSDEFDYNQEGKPTKAIIGLAILVALGIGLAFFKPTTDNVAKAPTVQERGSEMTQMNRAPGQTTGQVPTSTN